MSFPLGAKKKRLPTVLVWAQEFSPTSLMLLICLKGPYCRGPFNVRNIFANMILLIDLGEVIFMYFRSTQVNSFVSSPPPLFI
jgi:hypothetical protein